MKISDVLYKPFRWTALLCLLAAFFFVGCGSGTGDDLDLGEFNFDNQVPGNGTPPLIAFLDSYEGRENTILLVDSLFGILANDEFPIFETQIEYPLDTVNGGFLEGFQNGSFEYEPPAGFVGEDSFTYTLRDQQGRTSSAQVFIEVFPTGF